MSTYTPDVHSERVGHLGLITLNRPQALNALNSQVLADLIAAFAAFDADDSQRCAVLTGSEKAFAAGADIKEMQSQSFADMYGHNFFAGYDRVTATRKPWIAAVNGFALGGGATFTQAWVATARKSALTDTATTNPAVVSYNTAANTALVAANTVTTGFARIVGLVTVSVGGTVIPQVSLGVAATAVVGVGSYFKIRALGSATASAIGNWS